MVVIGLLQLKYMFRRSPLEENEKAEGMTSPYTAFDDAFVVVAASAVCHAKV